MAPHSIRTPEMVDAIIKSVRNGAYLSHACGAAGVSRRAFAEWCEKDEELQTRLTQARDEFTNEQVQEIAAAGFTDWRARAWILERTRSEHFREQKDVAVTGELTLEQVLFVDPADTVEMIEDVEELPYLPAPAAKELP